MPKKGSKRCRACGSFFLPERAGRRLCPECRELTAMGRTDNILEFERMRDRYNGRHGTFLTYGQFSEYIAQIRTRIKK